MTRQGGWQPTGFGVILRRERERIGLTQEQLAERAGCHHFTVAKLERGLHEPAWPLVRDLAKALGVCVSVFAVDVPVEEIERAKTGRGRPRKPPAAAPAPEGGPPS